MATTGTFDDVGVSNTLLVQSGETLTVVLSGAPAYVFNGTVAVQRSRTGGASWETPVSTDGTVLSWSGEQAADFAVSEIVKNESGGDERYRIVCTVFDEASDDLDYALTEVADNVIQTILFDTRGRPVLQVLDNGGLSVPGKLRVAGALDAEASAGEISPESIALASGVVERVATGTISPADIIGTSAGQFGHAEGVPMVATDADHRIELVSVVAVFDRITAAYTAGGNISVNASGGAALTGLVSAANSLGAASDAMYVFYPLTTAAVAMPAGLSLVSSAAFTNPGTAAGVVRWKCRYRLITAA
jgi:hypothetical protein